MTYFQFIHVYGYYCASIRPFLRRIFWFLCICWLITRKEGCKIWHADVSRWLTPIRHRCRRLLLQLPAFVRPSNCPWAWVLVLRTNHLEGKSIFWLADVSRWLTLSLFIRMRIIDCTPVCPFITFQVSLHLLTNHLEGLAYNWHVDVSKWFTLGRYRCRWVLLSLYAFAHPSDHPWDLVWVLRTNRLEEMVYILACWCIQIRYIFKEISNQNRILLKIW